MEKNIPELKAGFLCMCVREKNNSFEIHVIILRYIRNVNLPFKKDFRNLETVLKMAKETNKRDVESICAKVTKHASKKVAKAEANLN